jgi:Trehalose utilisation
LSTACKAWVALPGVDVLLSLDEKTVGGDIQTGPLAYEEHQPIAWKKTFRGGGRVFYNNMGHSDSTWDVPAYQTSLVEAVKWVGGKRPDAACLDSTKALPAPPAPPAAAPSSVGKTCAVPALKPRTGGFTWEKSGAAKRLTTTDTVALDPGIPGDLGWGGQTYVLDLSKRRARTADVTVDLSWTNPFDDYDLDVVTGWGAYGAHSVGTNAEHLVLKDVPTCAVLHMTGDNMLATATSGPTLAVTVGRTR